MQQKSIYGLAKQMNELVSYFLKRINASTERDLRGDTKGNYDNSSDKINVSY